MVGGMLGLMLSGTRTAQGAEPVGTSRAAAEVPKRLVRPPVLRPGQMVAIASPGEAYSLRHKIESLDLGAAALERAGYRVKIMPHARNVAPDRRAGTLEERVADLNQAFADPEIRMITGAEGGGGTLQVVTSDKFDWAALERDPKIICGFSDLAYLTVTTHLRLGLVTVDGPLSVYHWACLPAPPDYTTESFLKVAANPAAAGQLRATPRSSSNPFEFTGAEDMAKRLEPVPAWRWLTPGAAQGRLLAIRPDQMLDLANAGWDVSLRDRIWCFDPTWGNERMRTALWRVRERGLLQSVAGIVVARRMITGKPPDQSSAEWDAFLKEATAGFNVPIVVDTDTGHTIPRLALPNGILATLDSSRDLFSIDEPAVQ